MTTLHLLRHAKSSWSDEGLADRDRPLAPRGRRAARKLADHLRERGLALDLILCSPARRTLETLELIAPALTPTEVHIEEDLYGATDADLLQRLRRIPAPVESVLLIGHNPALQDLALALAAPGESVARLEEKFPTGALATLRIPGDWTDLDRGEARLVELVLPREL